MARLLRRFGVAAGITALWLAAPTVAMPAGPATATPHCGRQAARLGVKATHLGQRMTRVAGDPVSGQHWGISHLYCVDLTGDHRAEMVVLFDCCTITAPTPLAIFRAAKGRWRLSYSSFYPPLIYGLTVRSRSLVEKRPVYGPHDPLCCPSAFRYWSVRWTGRRWSLRRTSP
jgi:hypothetical protein